MMNMDEFKSWLQHRTTQVEYSETFRAPLEGEKILLYQRPFWTFVQYTSEEGPVECFEHSITGSEIRRPFFNFWQEGEKYRRDNPAPDKMWAYVSLKPEPPKRPWKIEHTGGEVIEHY